MNEKILIVEDDSMMAQMAGKRLEAMGYVVVGMLNTGEEAVETAPQLNPDLILMDIGLPGEIDGVEAVNQIRKNLDVPVVFLTAFSDRATIQRAKLSGSFGYLFKPFQFQELYSSIELAIYRHAMEKKLRESEEKYRVLVETMRDGLAVLDTHFVFNYVNPGLCRMTGYTQEELIGRAAIDLLDESDRRQGLALLSQPDAFAPFELSLRHKTGRQIQLIVSPGSILDEQGQVKKLFMVVSDVTRRKQTEEELRKLSYAVEQSSAMIFITDAEGHIQYTNPNFNRVSGYSFEEIEGTRPDFLKSNQHPPALYEEMWQTISAGNPWRSNFCNKKKDGSLYWVSSLISPIKNREGRITHFLAIQDDITEDKKTEATLRELLQQLETEQERTQQLAQQLVSAQEEERRRLSRELHDEAGQALTALKISLQLIQADISEDALYQRLGTVVKLADETLERVRVLAQNLRPPSLDAVGLNPTLEGFCRDFSRRTQLTIHYEGAEDLPAVSPEISISLYRFLQETLTNIIKHAGANTVWVLLQYDEDSIALSVEDNGKGLLPSPPQSGRLGLIGMQERFHLLGGNLDIHSQPDHGVRLTASIPREVKP